MENKEIVFPKTRKEVFKVLLKYHKTDLFKINLLAFLFGMFSLLAIYLMMLLIGKVPDLIANGVIEMVKPEDIDYSVMFTSIVYLVTLFIILVFTNIPLFLGLGGLIYVVNLLVYGEANIDIKKDFAKGIKRNAKNNIKLSLIFSFSCLFSVFVFGVYLLMETPVWVQVLSDIIAALVFFTAINTIYLALNHNNVYKCSFINLLKNSFLLSISHPFKTIGCVLLSCTLFFLNFIPMIIPIFPCLMIFFGMVFFGIIEILYSNSLFDLYINEKAHPELVRRGMDLDQSDK